MTDFLNLLLGVLNHLEQFRQIHAEGAEFFDGGDAVLIPAAALVEAPLVGPQDRELFRMSKEDVQELTEAELPAPGTTGDVVR